MPSPLSSTIVAAAARALPNCNNTSYAFRHCHDRRPLARHAVAPVQTRSIASFLSALFTQFFDNKNTTTNKNNPLLEMNHRLIFSEKKIDDGEKEKGPLKTVVDAAVVAQLEFRNLTPAHVEQALQSTKAQRRDDELLQIHTATTTSSSSSSSSSISALSFLSEWNQIAAPHVSLHHIASWYSLLRTTDSNKEAFVSPVALDDDHDDDDFEEKRMATLVALYDDCPIKDEEKEESQRKVIRFLLHQLQRATGFGLLEEIEEGEKASQSLRTAYCILAQKRVRLEQSLLKILDNNSGSANNVHDNDDSKDSASSLSLMNLMYGCVALSRQQAAVFGFNSVVDQVFGAVSCNVNDDKNRYYHSHRRVLTLSQVHDLHDHVTKFLAPHFQKQEQGNGLRASVLTHADNSILSSYLSHPSMASSPSSSSSSSSSIKISNRSFPSSPHPSSPASSSPSKELTSLEKDETPSTETELAHPPMILRLEEHVTLDGTVQFVSRLIEDLFGLRMVEELQQNTLYHSTGARQLDLNKQKQQHPNRAWDASVRLFHLYQNQENDPPLSSSAQQQSQQQQQQEQQQPKYVGSFYLDALERDGKAKEPLTHVLYTIQTPIIVVSLNVKPPTWDTDPIRLGWDDVETFLHELGHVIDIVLQHQYPQHQYSQQQYQEQEQQGTAAIRFPAIAGMLSLPIDRSEILPQFMEHWLTERSCIFGLLDCSYSSNSTSASLLTARFRRPVSDEDVDATLHFRAKVKVRELAQQLFYGALEVHVFSAGWDLQAESLMDIQQNFADRCLPALQAFESKSVNDRINDAEFKFEYDALRPSRTDLTPLSDIFRDACRGRPVEWYRYLLGNVVSAQLFVEFRERQLQILNQQVEQEEEGLTTNAASSSRIVSAASIAAKDTRQALIRSLISTEPLADHRLDCVAFQELYRL